MFIVEVWLTYVKNKIKWVALDVRNKYIDKKI